MPTEDNNKVIKKSSRGYLYYYDEGRNEIQKIIINESVIIDINEYNNTLIHEIIDCYHVNGTQYIPSLPPCSFLSSVRLHVDRIDKNGILIIKVLDYSDGLIGYHILN